MQQKKLIKNYQNEDIFKFFIKLVYIMDDLVKITSKTVD
jgi:hypothetical protein